MKITPQTNSSFSTNHHLSIEILLIFVQLLPISDHGLSHWHMRKTNPLNFLPVYESGYVIHACLQELYKSMSRNLTDLIHLPFLNVNVLYKTFIRDK